LGVDLAFLDGVSGDGGVTVLDSSGSGLRTRFLPACSVELAGEVIAKVRLALFSEI
jgi:hypothetical protein